MLRTRTVDSTQISKIIGHRQYFLSLLADSLLMATMRLWSFHVIHPPLIWQNIHERYEVWGGCGMCLGMRVVTGIVKSDD